MRRSDLLLLAATALCWGSSFMFIKVAIRELDPTVVMVLRCALGAIPLWIVAAHLRRARGDRLRRGIRDAVRTRPVELLAQGALTGIPLWLVAVGERHIDSGLAGIINATVPLWAALLAIRFDRDHPTGPRRLLGVTIGFSGIVLLTLARGSIGGAAEVAGILAVAGASAMYAVSAVLVRERLDMLPSIETAAWSVSIGATIFAVPALRHIPSAMPSGTVIGSIAALAALGTWLGFLCYYELLDRVGAARATMVTYLIPPLALWYGWLLLDEHLGASAIGAMAVILVGVGLGSRAERRPPATAPATSAPAAAP